MGQMFSFCGCSRCFLNTFLLLTLIARAAARPSGELKSCLYYYDLTESIIRLVTCLVKSHFYVIWLDKWTRVTSNKVILWLLSDGPWRGSSITGRPALAMLKYLIISSVLANVSRHCWTHPCSADDDFTLTDVKQTDTDVLHLTVTPPQSVHLCTRV